MRHLLSVRPLRRINRSPHDIKDGELTWFVSCTRRSSGDESDEGSDSAAGGTKFEVRSVLTSAEFGPRSVEGGQALADFPYHVADAALLANDLANDLGLILEVDLRMGAQLIDGPAHVADAMHHTHVDIC